MASPHPSPKRFSLHDLSSTACVLDDGKRVSVDLFAYHFEGEDTTTWELLGPFVCINEGLKTNADVHSCIRLPKAALSTSCSRLQWSWDEQVIPALRSVAIAKKKARFNEVEASPFVQPAWLNAPALRRKATGLNCQVGKATRPNRRWLRKTTRPN